MSTAKKGKKLFFTYSEAAVESALEEIKAGASINSTSKKYGIPYSTLFCKHSGKNPIRRKMGPETYLTENEEHCLIDWIKTSAERGFPVTKIQLLDSVQMLIKTMKKKTPFTDSRPGRHWYNSFRRRHPEISLRTPQNLTSSRASVTEESIRRWFGEIGEYFTANNYLNIFENPRRIFNSDESAFFLNPKENRVLVHKGEKTVYNFIGNDEKECLTTLITGNAAGELAPPMVMFTYERMPSYISKRIANEWGVGRSESGWMTGETFYEFITNVFFPWIKKSNIELPVILFVDGHRSHLTLPLSTFCSENGIILVALYPNATHILQPMDVAVFHTLKNSWRIEVRNWKIKNDGKKVTREFFCPILETALKKSIKPDILINGFRGCGLCPLNADAIEYAKYFRNAAEPTDSTPAASTRGAHANSEFLLYLENYIGQEKIERFRNSNNVWEGDEKDQSLFYFWKTLKTDKGLRRQKDTDEIHKVNGLIDSAIRDKIEYIPEDPTFVANALVTTEGDIIIDGDWLEMNVTELETPNWNHESNVNNISNMLITPNVESTASILVDNINDMLPSDDEDLAQSFKIDTNNNDNEKITDEIINIIDEYGHNGNNNTKLTDPNNSDVIEQQYLENENHIEAVRSKTPDNFKNIPEDIPTPFKSSLFWPDVSKSKSGKCRRSKEKIPTVVTSIEWKNYHQKKEMEKKRKEQEANERKLKRAEKAEIKNQKLRKKTSNPTETQQSKNSDTIIPYKKHDFVIVKYDTEYFPGQVLNTTQLQTRVNAMTRSGSGWKWPQTPDVLWYNNEDVMCIISAPKEFNKRGTFTIPEMDELM